MEPRLGKVKVGSYGQHMIEICNISRFVKLPLRKRIERYWTKQLHY